MKEIKKTNEKCNETLPVEEFVKNRILEPSSEDGVSSLDERITALNRYFDLSEAFHKPKGEGYKLVLNCLHKYLDFKFIRENNRFRFQENLFDKRVEILNQEGENTYQYIVSDHKMQMPVDGSKADIYYLLHEAEQDGIASRRCINYVNSNRLHLTAVLIQLIERIVDNLERNPLKKYQEYGHILRVAYMTPEYAELDIFELFDVLNIKKKKYYRIRNEAISLLSETLFGILAGEHGFAELYLSDTGIQVAKHT